MNFPEACLSMAVKVKNKGDEGKVAQGMVRLMEEDRPSSSSRTPRPTSR